MKLFTALLLIVSATVCTAGEALNASLHKLEAIQSITDHSTNTEYLQESCQALKMWSVAPPEEKVAVAHRMVLIHFERATRLAASGNFKAAASELSEEATMQKIFGGQIEFSTKSPDRFFRDLIKLQAQVTAETGTNPLAEKVGYSFQKENDDFTAARLELSDDVAGITVPDIESDEALALVHRISRQSGQFVVSAPKWLVVPKGRLPDVLKQPRRKIEFDSTGIMTVTTLQAGGSQESTVTNLDNATASSQLPSIVRPPIPKNASDSESIIPTLSTEPPSSTSWSIIAVLMVAAISVVWLVLKKRK
jgi:hypothetical protein